MFPVLRPYRSEIEPPGPLEVFPHASGERGKFPQTEAA